jgi:anti-sigma regulatory factor (Ser/Thr protein kinase)
MEIVRSFDAGPTAPRDARRSLLPLEGDLTADRLDDLRVVVSELVTNAVTHSGLRRDGSIVLKVQLLSGSRVRVEVADTGGGFPGVSSRPSDQHGRGLTIVGRLADRWGTEQDGGTKVWAELPIR